MTKLILVIFCTISAALGTLKHVADASNADSLKFVTVADVRGCPISLYYHEASRSFYLSPAFCITKDSGSLLFDAKLYKDSLTGGSHLSIPVLVSDSLLLTEARVILSSILLNPTLDFLQILGARNSDGVNIPLVMLESGQRSGLLSFPCQRTDCQDLISDLVTGRWHSIDSTQLIVTVRSPGSQIIDLQHQVSIANRSQVLLRQKSPSIIYGDRCINMRLHEIIKLNDYCYATVLSSMYRRAHYVVEPVLCYEGAFSTFLGYKGGVVTLTLQTKKEQLLSIIRRRLPEALTIDFLKPFGAELRLSSWLSRSTDLTVEPLRLRQNGNSAEIRIYFDTNTSRERIASALERNPWELLRHVNFRLDSQLKVSDNNFCTWPSESQPLPAASIRNDADQELSAYHPIDGAMCIRPAFKRLLMPMPDSLCAMMCTGESSCQAFSTASGSCELFIFDKCSLNVRDCGCSRRGQVYVRRREGLEPGQLCPSGFGHDLCGVKYKINSESVDWSSARSRSEAQPGLVIMADVIDRAELQHAASMLRSLGASEAWLGGHQPPGSAEPAGGWVWASCNRPISMSSDLWYRVEPNEYENRNENVTEMWDRYGFKLNDAVGLSNGRGKLYLSECLSPF